MCGEKPWRGKRFDVGKISSFSGNLDERNNSLRMLSEEWVVAEIIARAVSDCEDEGFQPCCTTFGLCGDDDVVKPGLEDVRDRQDSLKHSRLEPVVLV